MPPGTCRLVQQKGQPVSTYNKVSSDFKANFAWLLRSWKQMQQSRHAITQHRHAIRCHACKHRKRSWLLCYVQVESEQLAQLVFDASVYPAK